MGCRRASRTRKRTPPAPQDMTKAHRMGGTPAAVASLPKGKVSPRRPPVTIKSPRAEFHNGFMASASRSNPAKVENFGDEDLLQHIDLTRILFGEVIPLRRDTR